MELTNHNGRAAGPLALEWHMTPIKNHIEQNHGGNQAAFSRAMGVKPPAVTKWIQQGFIVTADGFIVNPATTKRDLTVGCCNDAHEIDERRIIRDSE